MNNKFKKGDYIERIEPGYDHETLFKVKSIQQSTSEYVLVSLSAPNMSGVLKAPIELINVAYRRLSTRKGRNQAQFYKILYKRDIEV